jgi:hypothetical protein
MRKYINFVEQWGNPEFPRFRIRNREDGYWTGGEWSNDKSLAKLYYQFQHAASDLADIELEVNRNRPSRKYKAVVDIEVFGDSPIDLNKLKDYLAEVAKLELTKPAPQKSTVHVRIDWDSLTEGRIKRDRKESK